MRFLQVFLLIAAFQIEIRVHADVSPNEPFWEPPKCAKDKGECRVQAGHETLKLPVHEGHLEAASGALLERKSDEWKLLKGIARLREGSAEMINGEVKTPDEAWIIDAGKDRIVVRAIFGNAHVVLKDGHDIEIPQGFEVWIGGLQTDGTNAHGLPEQVEAIEHLKLWAHVIPGTEKDIVERAKKMKSEWKDRSTVGAALYKAVIDRQIASDKRIEDQKRERAEEVRLSQEENRRMLYHAAFEK